MTRFYLALFLLLSVNTVNAQDDLLNQLEKQDSKEKKPVLNTFFGTRLINGHSVETKPGGALEFIITHRFGALSDRGYQLWGLDNSSIRLGLEYGITDKLGVGAGRSSDIKTFDYYVKYKFLQQQEGGFPITVTGLATAAYNALYNVEYPTLTTAEKMSYVMQVLIARKFSDRVSFQLMPIYLHRNTVEKDYEVNSLLSLGMGGRVKVTKSMAIVGEYYLRLNEKENNPNYDSFGLGIEFDTGGHVFQLVFTNSTGMMERAFLAESKDNYFDGGVHFGFNITRTFQLARNK